MHAHSSHARHRLIRSGSSANEFVPFVHAQQAIERKGEVEVKEWATYWVVLASLVLLGWLLDFTLSWLPFYWVIKLAFICALWHPSTKWALHVYTR